MTQQQQQTREGPALLMRASIAPSSVNEATRTVDVTWSTGAPVTRVSWTGERYSEVLSMDPKHIRLERLNGGAPVLDAHSAGRVASVLGVVEGARIERGKGVATVRFSSRADVEPVWEDVKAGILRSISIGYAIHKVEVKRATEGQIEVRTAVDWEPMELSFVPIPADPGAQVRAAENESSRETAEKEVSMPTTEDITAERQRVAAIDQLCRIHGVDGAQRSTWIQDGAEVNDVREAILTVIETKQRATHITPGNGQREQSMVRDAADALARRAGVPVAGEGHRCFGDARLLDIASRVLETGGVNTRTLSANEIAKRALSTSDFSAILGLAGEKTVRRAYDSVPMAHREVLRKTTANDFRAKHAISNASAGVMDEVPEGSNYPRQAASAEKASYSIKTYGSIIPFTRQLVVNDDFGMFESAARQRGRSAAETERSLVWAFINGNPDAPDGVACFHADHGNTDTKGAGLGVTAATLAAARKALRTMASPDGFATNGLIRHIVTSPDLETVWDQLLNGVYVPGASTTAMTATLRAVQLHVEPLVLGEDWYAFTDYNQCDHYEYAYLAGSEGPRVEQRVNFDSDSVELKVVLDFGVGCIDHRGAYWMDGA